MAVNLGRIMLVGCGPGAAEYLTDAARQAVARADVLVGAPRLLGMFTSHGESRIAVGGDIEAALAAVAEHHAAGRPVAVLTSGDPGLYSLAASVLRRFGRAQCEVVPGVSSVQVAFARLGLDWADARVLSAHGRMPEIEATELSQLDKVAILAGTGSALRWAAVAAGAMRGTHAAWLCESLTLADERIRPLTAEEIDTVDAASLSIVLLIRKSLLT